MIVGCTGSGKSTLLNVMGGWQLVQRPPEYTLEWEKKDGTGPLFNTEVSTTAVTTEVQFAHLNWFGNTQRPFTGIDTPGQDDPRNCDITQQASRDRMHAQAADFHHKLQALGHVHVILVLHNDVYSNRLNPATYEVLRMINEQFAQSGLNVWDHVILAYSKCNETDSGWRSQIATKKKQQQEAIKQEIEGCNVDIPILCLGGAKVVGGSRSRSRDRSPSSRSRSPRRETKSATGSVPKDFEELWQFISNSAPLDTSRIKPFDGIAGRWEKLIKERDVAVARAKAAKIYVVVMLKISVLLAFLFWRAYLIPNFVGKYLLFNFTGAWDEIILLLLFVFWLGPGDVWYSIEHLIDTWVRPNIPPLLDSSPSAKSDKSD